IHPGLRRDLASGHDDGGVADGESVENPFGAAGDHARPQTAMNRGRNDFDWRRALSRGQGTFFTMSNSPQPTRARPGKKGAGPPFFLFSVSPKELWNTAHASRTIKGLAEILAVSVPLVFLLAQDRAKVSGLSRTRGHT